MKIRPKNPFFYLATLLAPWQIINTYVEYTDTFIIFSRYYAKRKTLVMDQTRFHIADVSKIGFPKDLSIPAQEKALYGPHGAYKSQEIDFLLHNGKIISWNARPYTKRQCQKILSLFPNAIELGTQLRKALE